MKVAASSSGRELYQDVKTGRVCALSSEMRGDATFGGATLRHLVTGRIIAVPLSFVEANLIDDEQLPGMLLAHDVCSITLPFNRPAGTRNGRDIPLYGDLLAPTSVSINVGASCESRCLFCYTKWGRSAPDLDEVSLARALSTLVDIGSVRTVVFTGGEPTLRHDLPRLVRLAVSTGVADVVLQTNGRRLASADYCRELAGAGLRRVMISLHGAVATTHESLTRAVGSFAEALAACGQAVEVGLYVTVNMVICQSNVAELAALPAVLRERIPAGIITVRFSYPVIEGAAFDNAAAVLVPVRLIRDPLREAIRECCAKGFRVELGTIPSCVPVDASLRATQTHDDTQHMVHASHQYVYNLPRGDARVKLKRCVECVVNASCRGVEIEYLKRFGFHTDDFKPILE